MWLRFRIVRRKVWAQSSDIVDSVDPDVSLTPEMVRTARVDEAEISLQIYRRDKVLHTCRKQTEEGHEKRSVRRAGREAESEVAQLTKQQNDALAEIGEAVESGQHERFLIHGVTGSGKTEIYIRATEKVLDKRRKAIILVPEISLTAQIIDRFIGRFGNDRIAVLHSRLSLGERYDQWKKIRDGGVDIVIGARSAVFAPLEHLGLIVVDEEHESTYKSDHTPKYDTVEVAVKRLQDKDSRGVLILGSATPSVATYRRSEEGIYRLIKLTERYNKVSMPEVTVTDMRDELRSGNTSVISGRLYQSMKEQLGAGKQVMLFLNRRGYSTFISCRECGYVAKCPTCGLSLTYHKKNGSAVCHYCGYQTAGHKQLS